MNFRVMSGDKRSRSRSPSLFGRRTSEPRVEENPHCHSHWFSRSSREGPVTNDLASSSVIRNYNGSCLYENKDEHFRKLSQFCESLQGESPSSKFRWENLFAENPVNGNSKSSTGMKHETMCGDDKRGCRVSGLQLGLSSKDIFYGNNFRTFHTNIGASKDSNVKNNGDISRSFGVDDCSHLSSSSKFGRPFYETNDHVRDPRIFESAEISHRGRRNETSSNGVQASHLHSSAPLTESKGISEDEFHDFLEYKRARRNHIEQFENSNQYFLVQPCKRSDIDAAQNSGFSQQMACIPQGDFYRDSTRTSAVMDPVAEGFEGHESHLEETTRPRDCHDGFKEPFIIEGSYMGTAHFGMEKYGDVLGSGTGSSQNREGESYISREKLLLAEEDGYRKNYEKWSYKDGVNGSLVSKHEQDLSDMEDSGKLRMKAADSTRSRIKDGYRKICEKWSYEDGVHGSLESKHKQDLSDMEDSRKLRRKAADSMKPRVERTRSRIRDPRSGSSRKSNVFSRIQFLSLGDEKSAVEETDINFNCREKCLNEEDTSISLTSSKWSLPWVINHASPRSKPKRRDLKKRLGMPLGDPSSDSFIRERERKRNKRLKKANVDHSCLDVQTGDNLEEKVQSPYSKPVEDLEELNQLVKSAFLKFVKVLSENRARRKKFAEPGCGIIKCIVCGSKSKEFADTLSLSQHAYHTLEGSRAEHLGLHKALCWLMGWSNEAAPNGLWVRRMLPLVERLALKEDLIIWPPVLIIHNSSIAIDKSSQPVAISCEELEGVIRGMGCGGKIKVVRGKPGNQSVMIVTFGAMFSGLQEAERLHKSFADKNHGREEFRKISSSHLVDSNKDLHEATGTNTLENVLYGYLGLAEDLDKLDFETKKRCVVKSKKEIQSIVNASLHC